MFNHPYICLDTKQELSDRALKCWIDCVQRYSPSGIIGTEETIPTNQRISFYRRKSGENNHYVTVLTRNLNQNEAGLIAKKYLETSGTDADFLIHWSQIPIEDTKPVEISEDVMKAIALEAAKLNHNYWLRKRTDEGWRYSQQHNTFQKTSPMCRDWDSLPEKYKKNEYQRVISLLEVLDRMNLQVYRK